MDETKVLHEADLKEITGGLDTQINEVKPPVDIPQACHFHLEKNTRYANVGEKVAWLCEMKALGHCMGNICSCYKKTCDDGWHVFTQDGQHI